MGGSFFELITRYSERPHRDPGENRLTAVLTAVLRMRPSLARILMTRLLPQLALDDDPAVNTQATTRLADGRHAFLDMEITASGPLPTTIWVEVKRTSGESGVDQFEKYQEALDLRAGQRALLILAPTYMRGYLGGLPPAHEWRADSRVVPHWVSWEEVYAALADLLPEIADPWEVWALRELLRYLEMEGLQPVPINQTHLVALMTIAEAAKALTMLVANAEQRLAVYVGEPSQRANAARDYYYELRYSAGAVDPGNSWSAGASFGWGVDRTEVFAGISTPGESGPTDGMDPADIERWRASFGEDDWTRIPGPEYWIWKVLPLGVIAEAVALERQAECVTTFVRRTFKEVVASRGAV